MTTTIEAFAIALHEEANRLSDLTERGVEYYSFGFSPMTQFDVVAIKINLHTVRPRQIIPSAWVKLDSETWSQR